MKISTYYNLLFILSISVSWSQENNSRNQVLNSLFSLEISNIENKLNLIENSDERLIFKALVQIESNAGQNYKKDFLILRSIEKFKPSHPLFGWLKFTQSTFHYYYSRNTSYPISLNIEAYTFSKESNDIQLKKNSLKLFLRIFSRENTLDQGTFDNYKKEFINEIKTKVDSAWLLYYSNFFDGMSASSPKRREKSAQDLYNFTIRNDYLLNNNLKIHLYQNIALNFRVSKKNDSAKYFLRKIIEAPDYPFLNKIKFNSYLEMGRFSINEGNHKASINYYNRAKKHFDLNDSLNSAVLYDRYKAMNFYEPQKKYDSAYYFFKRSRFNEAKLDYEKNNTIVSELNTRLRTAEKEKQILLEQAKNKEQQTQKKQITIALSSTLLLGSIIAFLVYRNTKRKQRIAEQDRELQIQKTETILKEKELETINAMVSGQEKERLRLAGELHDNIGSTLATVRMQVENLERNLDKVEDPKALLQKANLLINETYEKVRGISHKSNSGVMAKEGLLPAVEKLARTVSTTNKLAIDVQDFGLENRIPNELEITIFRIIQELVTNIVKHANATEANISLTQHDNELNIMVEDNGKGFKVGKLEEKDGMGLGTIERRVEHLEGTIEVDSAKGRGTSVSIDIPLQ